MSACLIGNTVSSEGQAHGGGSSRVQGCHMRTISHLMLIGLMMVIVPLQTTYVSISFDIINKVAELDADEVWGSMGPFVSHVLNVLC